MSTPETPLETVPGFSRAVCDRLAAAWITTAEQFLATSATPDGITQLAAQLHLAAADVQALAGECRAVLPPETAAELERPVDPGAFGLGALPPKHPRES